MNVARNISNIFEHFRIKSRSNIVYLFHLFRTKSDGRLRMHDQQIGHSDICTLDGEKTVLCEPATPGWLGEKSQIIEGQ
jgi:hypothetical protein